MSFNLEYGAQFITAGVASPYMRDRWKEGLADPLMELEP